MPAIITLPFRRSSSLRSKARAPRGCSIDLIGPRWATGIISASLAIGSLAPPATAQTQSDVWAVHFVDFNIPAQPLEKALVAYSFATGVQLLYDTQSVAAKRSKAVVGRHAPQQALAMLLEGTGLAARYSGASAVTLAPVGAARSSTLGMQALRVEASPLLADRARFLRFAGTVRDAIGRALQNDAVTRFGTYEVRLRVWTDNTGRIERVEQQGTSGDAKRDDKVVILAQAAKVPEKPPEDMPQPIFLSFEAKGRR